MTLPIKAESPQSKYPDLDSLIQQFIRPLGKIQAYSKEGNLPEHSITAMFDRLQEISLQGGMVFGKDWQKSVRIFAFHLDEAVVNTIGTEDFFKNYYGKMADFVEQIPEYSNAKHVKKLLQQIRKGDFLTVHDKKTTIVYEKSSDAGFTLEESKPMFGRFTRFSYSLYDVLSNNFHNKEGIDVTLGKEFPMLIPVFNFQWPEPIVGKESEKAAKALGSYSEKMILNDNGELEPSNGKSRLTKYESDIAHKTGKMAGFVSEHLICGGNITKIIAAPLYWVKAIPYDSYDEQSWMSQRFSSDIIRTNFGYLHHLKL